MRAFSNPDAFPAGDLGVRIALEKDGMRPTEKQVKTMSLSWAPWRAYATVLLWQRLV
jgi:3-methyladenine DNA glycosylase/8-oxoguanine DNA glycosylase